ncbi:hypothetical protein [Methylocella sp.]|uniref:hypothetical protein n=1 Tax=Methylocella sp. TaxID=1978226 RepID=UPI00378332EF
MTGDEMQAQYARMPGHNCVAKQRALTRTFMTFDILSHGRRRGGARTRVVLSAHAAISMMMIM